MAEAQLARLKEQRKRALLLGPGLAGVKPCLGPNRLRVGFGRGQIGQYQTCAATPPPLARYL